MLYDPRLCPCYRQRGGKWSIFWILYLNASLGSFNTKSTYVFRKRYRIHNHNVKSIVPADKLLVYNVKEGWKPLCDFLECDVPTIAFPHENIKAGSTKKMIGRYGQQVNREFWSGVLKISFILVVIVGVFLAMFFMSLTSE